MHPDLVKELSKAIGTNVLQHTSVAGGDINQAYQIKTSDGLYFLKYNEADISYAMLLAEQKALLKLGAIEGIHVPEALNLIPFENGSGLMLEWISESSPTENSWMNFGQQLALLHRTKPGNHAAYGLEYDNYIGSLDQRNSLTNDWLDFYYEYRISPQIKMAIDSGLLSKNISIKTDRMFSLLSGEIPDEGPCLIHGDLWSGNLMFNQNNEAVFIDPAIYYGHREMDIAMMKLFGGFSDGFSFYQQIYPLEQSWEDRLKFWQLYYILVHVNLFGGHYAQSAQSIINFYSSRTL